MAKLKKYNLAGKEIGTVEVSEHLMDAQASSQSIKDYIVALRANARQWSANTKGRSEVKHTTKKPRPQKGTGNARQGSLVGPQYRGGGIVFGPKPKFDQHVGINKKERQAAIRHLIAEKISEGKLHVLESVSLDAPKTKAVAAFIEKCKLSPRTLFLAGARKEQVSDEEGAPTIDVSTDAHRNFSLSVRNLPKAWFKLAQNISGYDVALSGDIVVTEEALEQITEWLK